MSSLRAIARRLLPDRALGLYHFFLAALAVLRYGFPSHHLIVIGVTGTNGKTTVVHLLHEMLAASGHRVGSLSSLRFKIGERDRPNLLKMTMPGRLRLQRFLADCRRAGCRFVIIEVTSQGILQHRHRFIRFGGAVLTNITPEHIEAHGGFEAYRAAKIELFAALGPSAIAVLNSDDASSVLIAARTPAAIVWYGRSAIDIQRVGHPVGVIDVSARRIRLEIDGVFLETGLGGAFNASNILAAAASAMALGVSLPAIASALQRVSLIPGRLEFVQERPFAVVVDYANTPDAYEAVYATLSAADLQANNPGGRTAAETRKLICVFGAPGGGRDKWKRPELGRIAGKLCRKIILTSDDPDDEDPARIAVEIQSGMTDGQLRMTRVILDRRAAIRTALTEARPGDTVIITGMGAQPWLVVRGKKIPWDDRKVVKEELAKLF